MYQLSLTKRISITSVLLGAFCSSVAQIVSASTIQAVLKEEAALMTGWRIDRQVVTKERVSASISIRREAPQSIVRIAIEQRDSIELAQTGLEGSIITSAARPDLRDSVPSALPLGSSALVLDPNENVWFGIRYGVWVVTYKNYGDNLQSVQMSRDWEVAEKFTRRVLGRLAGLESSAMSGVRVGSQYVSARRGVAGETQLNLREWSSARGVALNLNMNSSMASFTVNGKTVVVPLASNKIKVGSQWTSADNISLLHDGEWFVPQTLLNAASGG